jgi:hypothetical protein
VEAEDLDGYLHGFYRGRATAYLVASSWLAELYFELRDLAPDAV